MVPGAGIEPARPFGQGILSPLRLPFRHPGNEINYSLIGVYFIKNRGLKSSTI